MGAASACTSGGDVAPRGASSTAIPSETQMVLPGIGIEVEDGLVFDGAYDGATRTVNVEREIADDSLYKSDDVPHTQVPGFEVTVDLGTKVRTLELVTGPWEATYEKQTEVLGWVSAFHAAIQAAAEHPENPPIDYVAVDGRRRNLKGYYCAKLASVVQGFTAQTGVVLDESGLPQRWDPVLFVCRKKSAKDFRPQANYGVKLSAFVQGGIARDFGGRPGRKVTLANGEKRTFGPGCILGEKNRAGLRAQTLMSVQPDDANAFCEPRGPLTTAECGAPFEQPSFPCFPSCLMGQLCYGLGTNRIWFDGALASADSVLCSPEDADCQGAVRQSYQTGFPEAYASLLDETETAAWTGEQRTALWALLIFNRCAAIIHSLSDEGVSRGCFQEFWEKQVMGVLPKALLQNFHRYLPDPDAFDPLRAEAFDAPFTTLPAYQRQICDHALVLGEAAREACKEYVSHWGVAGYLGGKPIPLFRIGKDLSLVVESRHASLYVAGGYLGVRGEDGVVNYSPEDLKDSINFVRSLNGFGEQ